MIDSDHLLDSLCRELTGAVGPDRAVTLDQMSERLGICRRSVEQLIQSRLSDLPFPVVAGAEGYFRPTLAAHLNAYRHSLRRRHVPLKRREDTVTAKAIAAGFRFEGDDFTDPPGLQFDLFTVERC